MARAWRWLTKPQFSYLEVVWMAALSIVVMWLRLR